MLGPAHPFVFFSLISGARIFTLMTWLRQPMLGLVSTIAIGLCGLSASRMCSVSGGMIANDELKWI
jgi:hypothetical protein